MDVLWAGWSLAELGASGYRVLAKREPDLPVIEVWSWHLHIYTLPVGGGQARLRYDLSSSDLFVCCEHNVNACPRRHDYSPHQSETTRPALREDVNPYGCGSAVIRLSWDLRERDGDES